MVLLYDRTFVAGSFLDEGFVEMSLAVLPRIGEHMAVAGLADG